MKNSYVNFFGSHLSKLFNGSISIVITSLLKQFLSKSCIPEDNMMDGKIILNDFVSHYFVFQRVKTTLKRSFTLVFAAVIFLHCSCQHKESFRPLFQKLAPGQTDIAFENT